MSKDLTRTKHPIPAVFEQLGIEQVKRSDQFSLTYRDGLLEAHVKRASGHTITATKLATGEGFQQLTTFDPTKMNKQERNQLIKSLYSKGKTQTEIARIFGLSQSMIARITTS